MRKTLTSFLTMMLFAVISRGDAITDDPNFVIGHLDNGLTYYLYHNDVTPGVADFYIAHNVGALQEEDNQNGLAHFLEHMAFNGTKHYPDKQLLEFLGREGVRFGYNVNAYTSRTETVYNISAVPLVRESFIDSVMVALRDWSCDISCEQKALDDERGVIHEEWRRRDGQRWRMMQHQTEILYRGCKHPDRSVLGDMDIILNFKREDILDFYHKWYRPDLQAIIIVGDIDVKEYGQRIHNTFDSIPASVGAPAKQVQIPAMPTHPAYEAFIDPQIGFQAFKIYYKTPYPPYDRVADESFYKEQLCRQIVTSVLGERMERACRKPGCNVKSAVLVSSDYAPDFFMSQFTSTPKKGENMLGGLELMEREIERMLRYGISREEFEMARFGVRKHMRLGTQNSSEQARCTNEEIVKVCIESFLRGAPCVLPARMKALRGEILSNIAYEDILPYPAAMFPRERAIYCANLNMRDALRTPATDSTAVKAVVDRVRAEDIQPEFLEYDHLSLESDPAQGKVVHETLYKGGKIRKWKMSNGATVWASMIAPVKGENHIVMDYRWETGCNSVPASEIPTLLAMNTYMRKYSGFRGHDRSALMNAPAMSGISFLLTAGAGRLSNLSVNASADKIEDAFSMAYIQITEPYFNTPAVFEKIKRELTDNSLKSLKPREKFTRMSDSIYYAGHPWKARMDSAGIARLDMDYMRRTFRTCYGDPRKLTVYITSDLPADSLKALTEKHIGGLPTDSHNTLATALGNPAPAYRGKVLCQRTNPHEGTPVCEIAFKYKIRDKGSRKSCATVDILDYIMSARCIAQIREARGGTYHVHFASELYREQGILESEIAFQTRPGMREVLMQDVEDIMDRMCAEGPTREEIDEAVNYYLKVWRTSKSSSANGIFRQSDQLMNFARYGIDPDEDFEALIRSVKASDIQKLARKLNKGDRFTRVYTEE